MLAAAFHALGWNDPHPLGEIDLVPPCAENFAATTRGQNQKLQGPFDDAAALSQLRYQARDFAIGQRGEMLDRQDLPPRGEQLFEMIRPPCRIVSLPETTHARPGQYAFDR